ncbi:MAG: ABC transporter ATP-binding protein [SAR324 cluster bacterium]|nr:ABC transporter ATP-binding protein [SAR324 cluster bacterium]
MTEVLVKIENVRKDYYLPKKSLFQKLPVFRALHGIDLEIHKGVSFGIVGESGCGKSTLARIVMGLDPPTSGKIIFRGKNIFSLASNELRHLRSHFQMVFQDPYGSLNPRQNVLRIVSEPLETLDQKINGQEKKEKVQLMLEEVGLNANDMDKFPHEFSGGQRQRIAIARALITRPSLIVADEAVSALDVSVQAQVLNLMMDLQEKYNLAYMFISHDLSVVETITDEIAVLFLGRVVEVGKTRDIFQNPTHPYTRVLMEAIPVPDPLQKKKKKPPIMVEWETTETGCPFLSRCSLGTEYCSQTMPSLSAKGNQMVACHNV